MAETFDRLTDLEEQLDSFDAGERRAALEALARDHLGACAATGANVNMHMHSFFSYNADEASPSQLAWQARKAGLYAAALCDFDVLDGLEEFIAAGERIGLRTAVNLETRAYFKEYANVDISSPGEPGVTYIMGGGFPRVPAAGTAAAAQLAAYRRGARDRNLALIGRLNARLPAIALDYEGDVLPLTPAGVATERHIVRAYVNKSRDVFRHPEPVAAFWADTLRKSADETLDLMTDAAAFEEAVRSRLAKKGGLGYEPPSVTTFPPVDAFIRWVRACDAVPMITWLDGTSPGEKDGRALLEGMVAQGAASLNIIPDRNWNIADPKARDAKRANLQAIVAAAEALRLPVNIGTEMNRAGLPLVDELDGPVLKAYKDVFVRGARIMVGQTLLARYAGVSYAGAAAERAFRGVAEKNGFFEAVGALPPLNAERVQRLRDMGPEAAWVWFQDEVRKERTA